jgi:rubredoxin
MQIIIVFKSLFEDLPDDRECPVFSAPKDDFEKEE